MKLQTLETKLRKDVEDMHAFFVWSKEGLGQYVRTLAALLLDTPLAVLVLDYHHLRALVTPAAMVNFSYQRRFAATLHNRHPWPRLSRSLISRLDH